MANSIDTKELIERLTIGNPPTLSTFAAKQTTRRLQIRSPSAIWQDPEQIADLGQGPSLRPARRGLLRQGGSVSQSVADRLAQEGLQAVFLEGGLQAWTESGQAIEAVPPPFPPTSTSCAAPALPRTISPTASR